MLGREVVKRQQHVAVLRETRGGLVVLGFVSRHEQIEGTVGLRAVAAIQIACSFSFASGCNRLGSLSSTLAVLCTQQRCSRVAG